MNQAASDPRSPEFFTSLSLSMKMSSQRVLRGCLRFFFSPELHTAHTFRVSQRGCPPDQKKEPYKHPSAPTSFWSPSSAAVMSTCAENPQIRRTVGPQQFEIRKPLATKKLHVHLSATAKVQHVQIANKNYLRRNNCIQRALQHSECILHCRKTLNVFVLLEDSH